MSILQKTISGRQSDDLHRVFGICCRLCGECSKNLCPHRFCYFSPLLLCCRELLFCSFLFFRKCLLVSIFLGIFFCFGSSPLNDWPEELHKSICICDLFDHFRRLSEELFTCQFDCWLTSMNLSQHWWSFPHEFLERFPVYYWEYRVV